MLRGSLDDFSLEDVLWLVDRTNKSGELTIRRPTGLGRLFFRDGLLYYAESDFARERLEAQLVRTGLVSSGDLREVEQRSAADAPVVHSLVARGLLAEEQLASAFQTRLIDIAFELMRREFGEFGWEANAKAEADVEVMLPVRQVIEGCAIRAASLDDIRRVVPSDAAIPALSKNPPRDLAAITITVEQWRLLALIDGRRSIEDIGVEAELNDLTVLEALHDLAARELLEIRTEPEVQSSVADTAAPTATATRPFSIVLMCTANRIRSPMAESFLRAHLGDLPVDLQSVGVEGVDGQPAIPEAVEVAEELGGDLSAHTARPLSAVDLSTADLVLGFESRHVRRAIRDGNAPPKRTFTLPQFVKCLERVARPEDGDVVARARAAVELAHHQRSDGGGRSRRTREIEIVDPLGGPISAYRNTALRIRELCKQLSLGLFGSATAE